MSRKYARYDEKDDVIDIDLSGLDARDVQVRKMAEEDLGLRPDAAADQGRDHTQSDDATHAPKSYAG